MLGWTMRVGRIFGVDLRLHPVSILFLVFSMVFASVMGAASGHGLLLWVEVMFAVAVRETGRALIAAWYGMDLSQLVLMPHGAMATYGMREDRQLKHERALALSGPIANFGVGLTLALLMFMTTSQVRLFDRPWVTAAHLIRSLIWTQVLLGGLHMLPGYPLDAGAMLRRVMIKMRGQARGGRFAAMLSQVVGLGLLLAGLGFSNIWLLAMGSSVLAGAQMILPEIVAGGESESPVETIRMRDVMLTEFSTLGASDTLEEALERSVHSLQEIFPVTRGPLLVGAVSRATLTDALERSGNGYVQGVMTRTLHVANAEDRVVSTLRNIATSGGTQMLPIVQDEWVVGIVTPQNLSTSMGVLGRTRRRQADRDGEQ